MYELQHMYNFDWSICMHTWQEIIFARRPLVQNERNPRLVLRRLPLPLAAHTRPIPSCRMRRGADTNTAPLGDGRAGPPSRCHAANRRAVPPGSYAREWLSGCMPQSSEIGGPVQCHRAIKAASSFVFPSVVLLTNIVLLSAVPRIGHFFC